MPASFRFHVATQGVLITIIRTYLKENIGRAIPLVHYFFDPILTPVESKANWSLIRFTSGITIDV